MGTGETIPLPTARCQLCGRNDLEYFPVGNQNSFWYCPSCELYQYGQLAGPEAYQESYHAGYQRSKWRKVHTAGYRLARVASCLQVQHPEVLEVGCSVGSTLIAGERLGWQMTGYDIDDSVVEACRNQGLNAMHYDGLQLPVASESFDAVVAWHVIEHVADVRETLADWYRVLRPGGVMVVDTPDASSPKIRRLGARYRQFWAAEHTYTFAFQNLSRFVEETGFEVLPDPGLGEIERLRILGKGYAAVYHVWAATRRRAGFDKAFSLFARKPVVAVASERLRRSA